MDFSQFETIIRWVLTSPVTSSPLTFAALTGLATAFVWLAVAPTRTQAQKDGRLDGYLHGRDIIEDLEMSRSFLMRVVVPALRKGLDSLASLSPGRDVRRVQQMLDRGRRARWANGTRHFRPADPLRRRPCRALSARRARVRIATVGGRGSSRFATARSWRWWAICCPGCGSADA